MHDPTDHHPQRKRRVNWLALGSVLLGFIALLCIVGVVLVYLWASVPSYISESQQFLRSKSKVELEQIADSLENRFSSELTGLRSGTHSATFAGGSQDPTGSNSASGDELSQDFESMMAAANQPTTRTIEMDVNEINAWIMTKSPQWLENEDYRLPQQVTSPMIAIDKGKPVVAFQFNEDEISQWVSLVMDVQVMPSGEATVKIDSVKGGNLPMPIDTLFDRFEDSMSGRVGKQRVQEVQEIINGKTFDTRFGLDRRMVKITDFQVQDDSFVVTLYTEPADKSATVVTGR